MPPKAQDIQSLLTSNLGKEAADVVLAKITPIQPIKVKPIQVSIKPAIKPIVVSPKISAGVSIKAGPGPLTRGSK